MRVSVITTGGTSLASLFDVLGEAGFDTAWVSETSAADPYLFNPVPDIVVGVFNPALQDSSDGPQRGFTNVEVALRAGSAAARGIRTLLIVPPPLPVPGDWPSIIIAPCPADNRTALRVYIWGAKEMAEFAPRPEPEAIEPVVGRQQMRELLGQLAGSFSPSQVEQIVETLLRQASAAVVKNIPGRHEVDYAFATSENPSIVYLVDIKIGKLTEEQLQRAEQRLLTQVIERRADLGLLIYHAAGGAKFPSRRITPLTVRLSVEDFIRELQSRSLTDVISNATATAIELK